MFLYHNSTRKFSEAHASLAQLLHNLHKPHLLLCEGDGVGMFRVFLDRNSDGEFAVGQNTRKNISSFMLTSGSPFSAEEDPGKLLGQLLLSREESTTAFCQCPGRQQTASHLYLDSHLKSARLKR